MNALVLTGERRRPGWDIAFDKPPRPSYAGAAQREAARIEHALGYVDVFPCAPATLGNRQIGVWLPIIDALAVGGGDQHLDDAPATPPAPAAQMQIAVADGAR